MSFSATIAELYDRLQREPLHPVWISLQPREAVLARAREIESRPDLPLAGKTFAVKDNFDVEGIPTTAGCPAYAFTPASTATVVRHLQEAGALLIGKTNMDQFATGLVGTRSPFGSCSSVFNERYISGGSSSGSAVAVAKNLVTFSLGTDTAGSGRVPAAFNGLIGLKPTRGLLSTHGVVPACRTLDCVSIFARTCREAHEVWRVARGLDPADPFSREPGPGDDAAPWINGKFRFGVPTPDQLEFFGDEAAAQLYQAAIKKMQQIGGEKIEIDFSVFRRTADLLYGGPWVAERLAAIKTFFQNHATEVEPVVRGIIGGAQKYTAVDTFEADYRLRELRQEAAKEWVRMDVLLLPTTGTIYTHEQIASDPVKLNTNLGYYTNFVNLMDLAAVAVPAGFRANGLPFGISLIGPTFTDEALLALADQYLSPAGGLIRPAPRETARLHFAGGCRRASQRSATERAPDPTPRAPPENLPHRAGLSPLRADGHDSRQARPRSRRDFPGPRDRGGNLGHSGKSVWRLRRRRAAAPRHRYRRTRRRRIRKFLLVRVLRNRCRV